MTIVHLRSDIDLHVSIAEGEVGKRNRAQQCSAAEYWVTNGRLVWGAGMRVWWTRLSPSSGRCVDDALAVVSTFDRIVVCRFTWRRLICRCVSNIFI